MTEKEQHLEAERRIGRRRFGGPDPDYDWERVIIAGEEADRILARYGRNDTAD